MPALSRRLTKEDCDKWSKNKLKNPITNYKISNKSLIYNQIEKECNASETPVPLKKNSEFTLDDCLTWEKDKSRNPKTRYRLSEKSKVRKQIDEICKPILDTHRKNQKQLTVPSQSEEQTQSIIETPSIPVSISPKKIVTKPNAFELHYPDLDDEHFQNKIAGLYELYKVTKYRQVKTKDDFEKQSNELCGEFEKTLYQYFISNYISSRTPYKGVLLYHGVGVGKTCSSITLAEGFLTSHAIHEEPKIWVVMPSALRVSFKEQIFSMDNIDNYDFLANQCTGDAYIKMAHILRNVNREKAEQNIKKLIKSRYILFTYDKFASFVEENYIKKNIPVSDKVIIVDEAHNIRSKSSSKEHDDEKRVYSSLLNIASTGNNNRMVLLSATPMYDQPEDIYDLLYLLDLNDNRNILKQPFPKLFNADNSINPVAYKIIQRLSSNYISYLKGKNPFTFAIKLSPKNFLPKLRFLTKEQKYDANGKVIDEIYNNWTSDIDESILLSDIGEKQQKYIDNIKLLDDNHLFKNRQPMNIVFEDSVGEKGFSEFFTTNEEANSLSVNYKKKYKNALYPDKAHLGKYSGKFLNLCNILKKSKGIVVIYSGYIWSGIVPIAACLEHMGFNREGSNNIVKNPDVIQDAPMYGQNKHPNYCILTSDQKEIMGNTTIDKLLKIVNSPDNIDGSLIKVVLMTPVASEGLSFYNVREMHVVDPWFHMNKNEQIIGRGIRNCRHQFLPLEERNVSVFLHASYDNDETETADITAYRISSKKLIQTRKIDKLIKDSALDCHLMKNINYFPKSLFELGKITITTSQNTKIDYQYGDDISQEPQCNYEPKIRNIQTFRKDANHHFIHALKNRIRKLALKYISNGEWYIPIEQIMENLQFDKQISYIAINESLHPHTIINGYMMVPYDNGIQIVKIQPETMKRIKLVGNTEKEIPKENKQYKKSKLENLSKKDINTATLELYTSLTPSTFQDIIDTIIKSDILSDVETFVAKCLYKQGALIKKTEIPDAKGVIGTEYIGYVDIFETEFKPSLLSDKNIYRDLTPNELSILMKNRKLAFKPDDMNKETKSWGLIIPTLNKKEKIRKNLFKLYVPGPSRGAKTGIECSSLLKKIQEQILQEYGVTEKYETKQQNCKQIAVQLVKNNRMTLYPEYKPLRA